MTKTTYSGSIAGRKYTVTESFGVNGEITLTLGEISKTYKKFARKINEKPATLGGYTKKELLDSGCDLLAEKLTKDGITFDAVKGILYPEFSDGYISLGYHTSPRTFTVRSNGDIYFQADFSRPSPVKSAFSPTELGLSAEVKPLLSFADGKIPVLFGFFDEGETQTETMYCVGQGDCDFEYGVWIRSVTLKNGEPTEIKYLNAGCCNVGRRLTVDEVTFMECLAGIFAHYEDIEKAVTKLLLPEKELMQVFASALMTSDGLINGFQPKYGNMFYSLESHNNFPPNFIMSIQTYALCGMYQKARLMAEHFLTNCVDSFGRIIYRQGDTQFYGYSGSEVGQLLWVIRRSFDIKNTPFIAEHADTLCKMADNLLSFVSEYEDIAGVYLIHMCAEADTNGRIYDYIQNTLWAVRGLDALCEILMALGRDCTKYKEMSELLNKSSKTVCEKLSVSTKYGELVPFQLQYTALPLTLSRCRERSQEFDDAEFEAYLSGDTNPRNDIIGFQNLLENNYANYRYYPEILSSFMLDEKYSEAINTMRESLGGELLCMTRFMDGIDDWPAYNNALYLLEAGKKDKYLLLMYSHILYHGLPDFGIFYEQVGLTDGKMRRHADSCLPSTLIPPFMLSSMFCHISADCKKLFICKGVPDYWFEQGFSADNLYVAGKRLGVVCRGGELKIELDYALYTEFEVIVSAPTGVKVLLNNVS